MLYGKIVEQACHTERMNSPSMAFFPSAIRPPFDIRSITEDMCFFSLVVSLGMSNVIGVAPWFSLPGLTKFVN